MRRAFVFLCCLTLGVATTLAQSGGAKTLDIYYIDTEGGQATLFVSPTGETMLVDTGFPGGRDLDRITEVLNMAGVKQIDRLWTTHYHTDHVGSTLDLAKRFPIRHFYDHGVNSETREMVQGFAAAYEALSAGKRTVVKPGDKFSMAGGVEVTTVASDGKVLTTNLPGGGASNPFCGEKPKDESRYTDPDNGQSAGFLMTYGRFRTVDLGDLTQNAELQLMCPTNHIGTIDLYLVTHHGIDRSNSPAIVHALQPRVAIMNNGTRKGGSAETFRTLALSPGLDDLWQLHWSYNVGVEYNAPGVFIANIDDNATVAGVLTAPPPAPRGGGPAAPGAGPGAPAPGAPAPAAGPATTAPPVPTPAPPQGGPAPAPAAGPAGAARQGGAGGGRGGGGGGAAAHTPAHYLKVSVQADGTFTVTNSRNGFSKTYKK